MQEGLKNLPEKTRDLANTAWAFGAALLILGLVLAFKRVYQRRQVEEKEARIQKQEQQEYERNFHRVHKIERPTNACEKITEQEFDYQQNVTTKREIAKLVNSQAYKDAMAKKGQNQSAWNWQSYDRDQGIIPNGEDREVENFDLSEELDKVENELKPASRGRTQISRYRTQ